MNDRTLLQQAVEALNEAKPFVEAHKHGWISTGITIKANVWLERLGALEAALQQQEEPREAVAPDAWYWEHVMQGSHGVIESGFSASRVEVTDNAIWDGQVATVVTELHAGRRLLPTKLAAAMGLPTELPALASPSPKEKRTEVGKEACACGNVERQGWTHRPEYCWPDDERADGVPVRCKECDLPNGCPEYCWCDAPGAGKAEYASWFPMRTRGVSVVDAASPQIDPLFEAAHYMDGRDLYSNERPVNGGRSASLRGGSSACSPDRVAAPDINTDGVKAAGPAAVELVRERLFKLAAHHCEQAVYDDKRVVQGWTFSKDGLLAFMRAAREFACACGNVERQGWTHRPDYCWPDGEHAAGVSIPDSEGAPK